jgi:PAS domain S-box-containing protein
MQNMERPGPYRRAGDTRSTKGGAMTGLLQATLAVLAGVCLFASAHHLFIGMQRPRHALHLWFSALSFLVFVYALNRLDIYHASSADVLVAARRLELWIAAAFFVMLPWFTMAYTRVRAPRTALVLNVLLIALCVANWALPYSVFYTQMPTLQIRTLPWGEQLVDTRAHQGGAWFVVAWSLVMATCSFSAYACMRQYREGDRGRALRLAAALGVFLGSLLFSILVNAGWVHFTQIGEFGFIGLVLLMSAALTHELRTKADALLASETRFRSLVEQSPFSIQILAPDGRTLQVNRAWENLWGVKAQALVHYNVREDRQLMEKGVMPYIEQGFTGMSTEIPPIVYNPAATPDFTGGPALERWVRAFIYPVKNSAGQVQEVILMHEDITERKWSEDALHHIASGVSARTGEEFFRQLVQHLAALFAADYAFVGLVDRAQPGIVTTLAVCAHGAIAPNMSYELDNTPCANVVNNRTCAYPSGVQHLFPQDALLVDMGADGYIGTPLFDAQGLALGLIVVLSRKPLARIEQLREILEIFAARTGAELQRLRAEQAIEAHRAELEQRVRERTAQLEAANQELESFSYSVSHDLRAPLRAVNGFSQAFLEDYGDTLDATGRSYLERVRYGTLQMGALIDDLLKLSRVSRAALQPADVDLSAVAREVAARLREQVPERQIRIDIADGLRCQGDLGLLRIVLENLLGNAWKYTGKTGEPHIIFDTVQENENSVFRVRDNGAGFDMKFAGKLFGAFQRLHHKDEFEGTGIGLATVQRIIHRHGGRVWAESKPGEGATFYFSLTHEDPTSTGTRTL